MSLEKLLEVLAQRFEENPQRHPNLKWAEVESKLSSDDELLKVIEQMEQTGGQPDVIELDQGIYYVDLAPESPKPRSSLCYDQKARVNRKKYPPQSSVEEEVAKMGSYLMDEAFYHQVQAIENFDCKTSSWIWSPESIRDLGGALFCDRRYDHVFTYHNGADSYYASRGFRTYYPLLDTNQN